MDENGRIGTAGSGIAVGADAGSAGLVLGVAEHVEDLLDAWELVYRSYLEAGLIQPNRSRLHTVPQATRPRSATVIGRISRLMVTTLTAMVDGSDGAPGLPLDRVYADQLDALRGRGRIVMELGLFADRRRRITRCAESLFDLVRYAFHFGRQAGVTDCVMAVHRRQAQFYMRSFGFTILGEPRQYAALNGRAVILLHGDFAAGAAEEVPHPAMAYFLAHPIGAPAYADRVSLHRLGGLKSVDDLRRLPV